MDWITEPLEYGFMQRAMMEAVIVGALCGLVGCFVVLRGLAFIGDALAHAVFPGVVLSYIADRSILIGAFIFGSLTALGIAVLSRSRRVSEDSAIGVIFAAFFALGVVILSRQGGFRRDLGSLLFGNILGVSMDDVWITAVIAVVVAAIVVALLKEFTLIAFDPAMARAAGYPVFALDVLLLLLVSATIVVSLQTVGNILILALIVTPPATARLLTGPPRGDDGGERGAGSDGRGGWTLHLVPRRDRGRRHHRADFDRGVPGGAGVRAEPRAAQWVSAAARRASPRAPLPRGRRAGVAAITRPGRSPRG